MVRGFCKWFNDAKGFGFIRFQGAQDVFVHYTAVQSAGHRTLFQNEEVEFDIVTGSDGRLMAANVWRSPENEAATVRPVMKQ